MPKTTKLFHEAEELGKLIGIKTLESNISFLVRLLELIGTPISSEPSQMDQNI